MSASHLLVLNSIIYSIILGIGFFFFYYINAQRKISLFVILLFISILPILSIFRSGSYESGDLSIHVMEGITFYKYLGQGDLFPRWGGDFNGTYGYPSFEFTYPLPFYLISIFHFLNFSFTDSTKLVLASSFILSGVFMYKWLQGEMGERGAFVGAIAYLFAPYHLIDLHFRADIGEIVAFVLLPLIMLCFRNFQRMKRNYWLYLEIISIALLFLSHPAIASSGLVLLVIYIIYFSIKKKMGLKELITQLICIIVSLALVTFYWLPVVYDLKYTAHVLQSITFISPSSLLYSPWRYGLLFQGPMGQLSFLIGYGQLVLSIAGLVYLLARRNLAEKKELLVLSLMIVLVLSFLMTNYSKVLWEDLPFLKSFQYTYRLLGLVMFCTAVISAIVVDQFRKKWFFVFISLFLVFSTILNWGNRKNMPEITDSVLKERLFLKEKFGEGLFQAITVWSNPKEPWADSIPKNHIEVLKGNAVVKELNRINIRHVYIVDAAKKSILKENTLFFPGWNLLVDQKPYQIEIFNSSRPKGLISFTLPSGLHKVELVFRNTVVVLIGEWISLVTLLGLLVYAWSQRRWEI